LEVLSGARRSGNCPTLCISKNTIGLSASNKSSKSVKLFKKKLFAKIEEAIAADRGK